MTRIRLVVPGANDPEIEVGLTSSDWEPDKTNKFYAQHCSEPCEYVFGPDPVSALTELLKVRNLE